MFDLMNASSRFWDDFLFPIWDCLITSFLIRKPASTPIEAPSRSVTGGITPKGFPIYLGYNNLALGQPHAKHRLQLKIMIAIKHLVLLAIGRRCCKWILCWIVIPDVFRRSRTTLRRISSILQLDQIKRGVLRQMTRRKGTIPAETPLEQRYFLSCVHLAT
jgi:hypothetical protein